MWVPTEWKTKAATLTVAPTFLYGGGPFHPFLTIYVIYRGFGTVNGSLFPRLEDGNDYLPTAARSML